MLDVFKALIPFCALFFYPLYILTNYLFVLPTSMTKNIVYVLATLKFISLTQMSLVSSRHYNQLPESNLHINVPQQLMEVPRTEILSLCCGYLCYKVNHSQAERFKAVNILFLMILKVIWMFFCSTWGNYWKV